MYCTSQTAFHIYRLSVARFVLTPEEPTGDKDGASHSF